MAAVQNFLSSLFVRSFPESSEYKRKAIHRIERMSIEKKREEENGIRSAYACTQNK
jgi:hypothetical protein